MAEREYHLLLRFNSCSLTTYPKELTIAGRTYQPGLNVVGELQADSSSTLEATREACNMIIAEPRLQHVIAELIDRDDQWSNWRFGPTHILVLSEITNYGFNRVQIDLLPPEAMLAKAEKEKQNKEYVHVKYGPENNWYNEISEVDKKIARIKI